MAQKNRGAIPPCFAIVLLWDHPHGTIGGAARSIKKYRDREKRPPSPQAVRPEHIGEAAGA